MYEGNAATGIRDYLPRLRAQLALAESRLDRLNAESWVRTEFPAATEEFWATAAELLLGATTPDDRDAMEAILLAERAAGEEQRGEVEPDTAAASSSAAPGAGSANQGERRPVRLVEQIPTPPAPLRHLPQTRPSPRCVTCHAPMIALESATVIQSRFCSFLCTRYADDATTRQQPTSEAAQTAVGPDSPPEAPSGIQDPAPEAPVAARASQPAEATDAAPEVPAETAAPEE